MDLDWSCISYTKWGIVCPYATLVYRRVILQMGWLETTNSKKLMKTKKTCLTQGFFVGTSQFGPPQKNTNPPLRKPGFHLQRIPIRILDDFPWNRLGLIPGWQVQVRDSRDAKPTTQETSWCRRMSWVEWVDGELRRLPMLGIMITWLVCYKDYETIIKGLLTIIVPW